jgi:gliding motility-associated lipoprotein GldD
MRLIVVFVCILFISFSCGDDNVYLPKPRMYPKINLPEGGKKAFDESYCKMTFNYPEYASIEKDNYFFEGKPIDPCWFNVQFNDLAGSLHCSYIPIENRAHYDKLINESFRLVEEHNSKANYRQEEYIQNANGVGGLYFTLGGEVATNMQYILTDTTQHFFRASLYFNSKVRPDSIRPIYEFVKKDVDEMIESFNWND